jgi:hypothetical protein
MPVRRSCAAAKEDPHVALMIKLPLLVSGGETGDQQERNFDSKVAFDPVARTGTPPSGQRIRTLVQEWRARRDSNP